MIVSLPGFHPAGQTSPCLSVYWKAWTNRRVSSTDLPTYETKTKLQIKLCWQSTGATVESFLKAERMLTSTGT